MTLELYTPERLERLAMRFFDLAAEVREMAKTARQKDIESVAIHDKKVLLWIDSLEHWAKKSRAAVDAPPLRAGDRRSLSGEHETGRTAGTEVGS